VELIKLKLQTIPEQPGVYQYFDKSGEILYIGKAKNLKKRVNSYFVKNHENAKTRILVRQIQDIKYIVVDSEIDALLLENSLIKKYQPKYNIQLKDDKTYPWICIKNEPFPRVFSTRTMIRNGSTYYGPYPNVKIVNTLLELIRTIYPLRSCSLDLSELNIKQKRYKVCLEYHIGNCKGPCVENQSSEDYQTSIRFVESILKGQIHTVIQYVKTKMMEFASQQKFEEAQIMKNKVDLLENYKSKSTIVSPKIQAVDVISAIEDNKSFFVNYLVISNGSIIHGITIEIQKKLTETIEEILSFAILELRNRFNSQSKEVLVDIDMLNEIPGFKWVQPLIGDKKQLVELSQRNAKFYRLEKIKHEKITNPEEHAERILERLQKDLSLKELPRHIECFDNSNIQGTNAVSACVVFINAKPCKKEYRHFNVQTVEGPDDFATMEEVVYRRYKRRLEENLPLPQLIIIDGGKGQLGAALKALDQLELRGKVAIIGIAKRLEEIFYPGDSIPIYIDKRSESLKLIQQLRNEAHRFGITHHRNKRSKNAFVSEISSINGIGEKTFEQLMLRFKTLSNIKNASIEEITDCIGKSKGNIVWRYFQSDNANI
jgi:excinuclease ABC subunit C